MTARRWTLLLACVGLAAGGPPAIRYLKLRGLGLLSRIMDPIHAPREVVWEPGPAVPTAPVGERLPNIVVIVADDLGFNDLTWAGGGVANGAVPTPHIDSIARSGVQLTAGYADNATCAPSRAAILTTTGKDTSMNVTNETYPTAEQLMPLLRSSEPGPIAMVNLLKFRKRAVYADGRPDDVTGREAYMRYVQAMRGIVERAGGRFLFSGDVGALVIGAVDELWDAVGIAEYPSRAAFHRIATSPEVQAIGVHREAGLAGQLLILTVAQPLV